MLHGQEPPVSVLTKTELVEANERAKNGPANNEKRSFLTSTGLSPTEWRAFLIAQSSLFLSLSVVTFLVPKSVARYEQLSSSIATLSLCLSLDTLP